MHSAERKVCVVLKESYNFFYCLKLWILYTLRSLLLVGWYGMVICSVVFQSFLYPECPRALVKLYFFNQGRGRGIWIIKKLENEDWYSDKVLHVSFHITFKGFWSLFYLIILCFIKKWWKLNHWRISNMKYEHSISSFEVNM